MAASAVAADWPGYRGPHGDGTTSETLREDWAAAPPVVVWRRPLEPGWSSSAVAGGRLYTQVKRVARGAEREFVVALDTATGTELWAREVDNAIYDNLAGYDDRHDGPRSTPLVSGDRVFVLTSALKLYCLSSSTGEVRWRRDFPAEYPGTSVIAWQNAASPLLVGDLILLNANTRGGRLTAVRASDGVTVWRVGEERMTHATPVRAVLGGEEQVVFLTAEGLVAVTPAEGTVRWRLTFSPSSTSTAANPVIDGDLVYASSAYSTGAWVARVARSGNQWNATQHWALTGNRYQNHWSTPVVHEGFLYSVSGPGSSTISLAGIDLQTGHVPWSQRDLGNGNLGFGSIIKVGGLLLVLTESGELVLVRPNPNRFEPLGRMKILDLYSWNSPAFSRGRLYARSSSEMVALDLAPPTVALPSLRLGWTARVAGGPLVVRVDSAQGGDLPADAAARIALESTPVIPAAGGWTVVPGSWQVVDGGLEAEITPDAEARYLRTRVDP